jgi:hypothetical protein
MNWPATALKSFFPASRIRFHGWGVSIRPFSPDIFSSGATRNPKVGLHSAERTAWQAG